MSPFMGVADVWDELVEPEDVPPPQLPLGEGL
jgi:hypothetical protein